MTDEIAALRERIASLERWYQDQRNLDADAAGAPSGATRTFYADELEDPVFWAQHRAEILTAAREGRVRDRPASAPEPSSAPAQPSPVPNGSADGGAGGQAAGAAITTSRIADSDFYRTHRAEIDAAIRAGAVIVDD